MATNNTTRWPAAVFPEGAAQPSVKYCGDAISLPHSSPSQLQMVRAARRH